MGLAMLKGEKLAYYFEALISGDWPEDIDEAELMNFTVRQSASGHADEQVRLLLRSNDERIRRWGLFILYEIGEAGLQFMDDAISPDIQETEPDKIYLSSYLLCNARNLSPASVEYLENLLVDQSDIVSEYAKKALEISRRGR